MATPMGTLGYTSSLQRPKTTLSGQLQMGGSNVSPTGTYVAGKPVPPKPIPKVKPVPMKPVPPKINTPIPGLPGSPGIKGKLDQASAYNKKNPAKPATPAWQDADYNSQMRAIQRALDLYKSRMGLETSQAGTQYAESGRELDDTKGRDLSDMADDFASRGVITSGVYGTSVGDYNEEWGNQKASLSRQYKDALALISQSYNEYLADVQAQREEARLDAVRRRAQGLETNPAKAKAKAKAATGSAANVKNKGPVKSKPANGSTKPGKPSPTKKK